MSHDYAVGRRRTLSIAAVALPLLSLLGSCTDTATAPPSYVARTRTYYVAAEAVRWNYIPWGYDSVFGRPLPHPWVDSASYPKIRYVEYTDATFAVPRPQPAWLGILGPILRGVVGDTLKVVFLNRASIPLSMHPHGVTYSPADEGALYNPPRGGGDSVTSGGQYTYTWFAQRESGPLPGEPSSKVWLYHSHALMPEDETNMGLMGVLVITDPAHARADATPDDVDREFVTMWTIFNENPPGGAFLPVNLRNSLNGYLFGNFAGFLMNQGERVRWYAVALGSASDLHTPHWHGEKVLFEGRTYTDVIELLPASMHVGDMVADNPGTWLLHCHVSNHMTAGMFGTFTIAPTVLTAAAPRFAPLVSASAGWAPFADRGRGMQH
jgi:hypothetical protein